MIYELAGAFNGQRSILGHPKANGSQHGQCIANVAEVDFHPDLSPSKLDKPTPKPHLEGAEETQNAQKTVSL